MNLRLGRHPTRQDYRTLRFVKYATGLPLPPPSFDAKERVYAAIGQSNAAVVFPMDGNDNYGDCTIAARAHADTLWRAFVRNSPAYVPSAAWCLRTYLRLTGGVDSGLDCLTAIRDWARPTNPGADRLVAYVAIDPAHHTHMQQAIALFGCIYVGFQCQAAIIDEFNAHRPWVPGPLINDGHCVAVTGYTGWTPTDMLNVLTWGADYQQGTWAWWDECAGGGRGEAYAMVPLDARVPGFAPGFDLAQLEADLKAAVAG